MTDWTEILASAKNGDEAAFEQIVLAFEKKVYAYLFQMLANREDAMEATQDTFLRLWRTLPGFRSDCSLSGWIFRIARTAGLDALRAGRPDPVSLDPSPDDEDTDQTLQLPDESVESDPVRSTIRDLDAQAVHRAIAKLSPPLRDVLVLRYMQNLSYDEIAQILGTSAKVVKSRLDHAKKKMKILLLQDGNFSR